MRKTKKVFLLGACAIILGTCVTVAACGGEANKKIDDLHISYGETLDLGLLFGEKDTFENVRLTDEDGNRLVIKSNEITISSLGEYKLQLQGGYYTVIVADTTAPKATATMYCTGVGEQAEIVLNVFDNMDKTVENVSYGLYYGTEEIALSETMLFTPQSVGAYRFDVEATDEAGNHGEYSFTFTVAVDTDRLMEEGETVTVDDTLFDGVVADKTAYDFSYEITKNTLNIEKPVSGDYFIVDDNTAFKVNAIATEKANAENKIIIPYTYHTDNIAHAHFLGEQANTSAFLVNDAMGLYHGIGTQENGRRTFNFGFTGEKIDSRAYLTIGGFEPNTHYEYMSFDLTANVVGDGLVIAMYPTQEMGKRQEYVAITAPGTRRVVAQNQTTDENGILRLFAYFFRTMDIEISNLQLYKTLDTTTKATLDGYDFVINPGKAVMDAEVYEDKIVTSWFSEPNGDRPGFSVGGLEAGQIYDVSIDVETNINTVFYFSDTANKNNHYGFLTENIGETKRTFVFQQLVADDNGYVHYDGLYIKGGVIDTWSNLKVSKHNTAKTTYGTGEDAVTARYELLNSEECREMVHPYVQEGKLGVDVGKGSLGNTMGARPQLVLEGLKAEKTYAVTIKATLAGRAVLVAPYWTQNSKGDDHYGVFTEAGEAEWTTKLVADSKGEIVFGAWYIGAWTNVTFTEITAVEEKPPMGKYGEVSVILEVVDNKCDAVTTSVVDNKYVIQPAKANSFQSGVGNNRGNGKGAALTFSGLQANKSYTIDMQFDVTFTDPAQTKTLMIFTKDGSTKTNGNCFQFVEGTTGTKNGNSAIGNVNSGDYSAGTYVLRLVGTTDENGTVAFTGWYFTDTTAIVTITNVTAKANG